MAHESLLTISITMPTLPAWRDPLSRGQVFSSTREKGSSKNKDIHFALFECSLSRVSPQPLLQISSSFLFNLGVAATRAALAFMCNIFGAVISL